MAVTKSYIDAIAMEIKVLGSKPLNPQLGDVYFDTNNYQNYIWDGNAWKLFSLNPCGEIELPSTILHIPTEEQLEKHPALKKAWEEFLVIKKLIGV